MLDSSLDASTLRRRADELGPFAWALVIALAVTVVLFLFVPALAVFPFVAVLLLTGYGWVNEQATTAYLLAAAATASAVLTLGFITLFLFLRAAPAIAEEGLGLFVRTKPPFWSPPDVFSLVPMMWGTFLTTVIAAVIAAPLGVLGALFISEIASPRVREVVKPAIEILAGIPSIVYGYIGFTTLNEYMGSAFLDSTIGSFLIAGVVIGVMALPTVVSVAEDALSSVPDEMRDGSLAMGATNWQTMKSISLPASFSGISAAIILGIGRAVGETMAAASILGASVQLPSPLYDVFSAGSTLTTLIATHYGNASDHALNVMFAAGVLLFVVVSLLSIASQLVERRMKRKLRGET